MIKAVLPLILLSMAGAAVARPPGVPDDLLRALATARGEVALHGDSVWPGYSTAPHDALLVRDGMEYLICHPVARDDFGPVSIEAITECTIQARAATFPDNLLAAMPVFSASSTIVMGTPERTRLAHADWLRTIFHEHFHQYQSAYPGYYPLLESLDLKGSDETGMWMLNYPFPYDEADVNVAFKT